MIVFIAIILFVLIALVLSLESIPKVGSDESKIGLNKDDLAEFDFIVKHFDNKPQKPIYTPSQLDSLKYRKTPFISTNCHAGQRKLLLTEIQFYTNLPKDSLIIYSGSASGEHTSAILNMFPGFKFLLIDPAYHIIDYDYTLVYQNPDVIDKENLRKFVAYTNSKDEKIKSYASHMLKTPTLIGGERNLLEPSSDEMEKFNADGHKTLFEQIRSSKCRIFIIQDYLTPELTDLISRVGEFSYVSDIRSTMIKSYPTDMDYLWNDALQLYLIKKLKPLYSMLKFHPPYFDDDSRVLLDERRSSNPMLQKMYDDIVKVREFGLDMFDNYSKGLHMYLPNIAIYLQAWAPVDSSETRLIIAQQDIEKMYINYDHENWDNRFYYLRRLRMFGYFPTFYETICKHPENIYDGCFDCMLEMFILGKYISGNQSWTMSVPTELDLDKLFMLTKTIEDSLLFPSIRSNKCGFHDQFTKQLKGLNMFIKSGRDLFKIGLKTQSIRKIYPSIQNLGIADNTVASNRSVEFMKRVNDRS
jgi:hypothetical protein